MSGAGAYAASQLPVLRDKAVAAQKLEEEGEKRTDEQKKDNEQWEGLNKDWVPEPEKIAKAKEVETYRGNYAANFKRRVATVKECRSVPYYSPGSWNVPVFLLLGMGLCKAGVLTGDPSVGFYAKLLAVGYGLGLTLNATLASRLAGGANRVRQLHSRSAGRHDDFLWGLRIRLVRQTGAPPALLPCGGDLDRATDRQSDLVAPLSFRPAGMGVAIVAVLGTAAVSA